MNKDVKKHNNGDFEVVDTLHDKKTALLQPYAYNADAVSLATGLYCPEPTLTQQNTAEQTDINYIVATFTKTGQLPAAINPPTYGDFTGVSDYQTALDLIREADNAFNSLPAGARAHFDNNPALFLDFMENGSDPHLLDKLGISDYLLPQVSNPETDSTVTPT